MAYLFQDCSNQSHFLDNKLNNKTPISFTSKKASKKGLKKSSLKAIKKKATKGSSGGPIEDALAINK